MSSRFETLVAKLKEIFQIDKPELDFGIYRIIGARREQINDFLDNRLAKKVQTTLAGNAAAEEAAVKANLAEAIENAKNLGIENPDDLPKVRELKEKLAACSASLQAENEVYSHLLTFFSRYYDKGDFISQRRYKGDTYAIPYSGEEVKLHWANADQYYIKSGESFTNYDFSLPDGAKVHFRLVSAELTKDNIKDNDAVRCFVLWDPNEFIGEGTNKTFPSAPIEEKNGDLYVYFQYRRFKKGTKQKEKSDTITAAFFAALIADPALYQKFILLDSLAPTEKDKKRKLFRKYLDEYTAKNTSDYFIHKDLKGFLSRELDFYIKNEMMHLDDIQHASSFAHIEKNLRMIQAVRGIAMELINLMAQIENFQKKLWKKKKFVIESDWCISMCYVPQKLWDIVIKNKQQITEWQSLFNIKPSIDSSFLINHKNLVLDTQYFDETFKNRLINEISEKHNLSDLLMGELFHGDNYHCLRLISNRYKNQIKCIYIDPPYNSPSSEVLYKNSYKHSSWLSLIDSRMKEENILLAPISATVIAIDKYEHHNLFNLCIQNRANHDIVSVSIEHNKKGVQGDHFSFSNEYAIFCISDKMKHLNEVMRNPDQWEYSQFRNWGTESERKDAANCFYPIYVKGNKIIGFGEVLKEDIHPVAANEIIVDAFQYYVPLSNGKYELRKYNAALDDSVIAVWPIDSKGIERKWRYAAQSINEIYDKLRIKTSGPQNVIEIEMPKYKDQFKTLWTKSIYNAGDYGTRLLSNMGIPKEDFAFPKSIYTVKDCIHAVSDSNSLILDYFAGSGTTAQAVMLLNEEDGGNRKFILCEMGEYFKKVTLPRVKKAMYAPHFDSWKDGIVRDHNQTRSCFLKYNRIESYEDALNNIELQNRENFLSNANMQDEYLLKYMLDFESRNSIINTDSFRNPFAYNMKITVDSSGASEIRKVDLVETFNYLLGLQVESKNKNISKGYVTVEGRLNNGKRVLIFWRDCDKINSAELNKKLANKRINPKGREYDYIYVNGDHSIANLMISGEQDTPEQKVRSIEEEFLTRMFEGE